jgi:hypothetical protein
LFAVDRRRSAADRRPLSIDGLIVVAGIGLVEVGGRIAVLGPPAPRSRARRPSARPPSARNGSAWRELAA